MTDIDNQYCTFALGGLTFGIPVRHVQEVIRYQAMTPVPLASPTVRGLINLRGQIVTAVDLRRRLGLPDRGGEARPMNIVVRADGEAISLLVDEIGDVTEVADEMFEEVPETIEGSIREIVAGVYKLNGRLLLVLDVGRAVDAAAAAA